MAILYNEKTKVFTLQTKNSAYQMKVAEHGVLLHTYYGQKIGDGDLSYLIMRADRGFSGNPYEAEKDRTFSLDCLPLEYPCFGIGDYRTDCIQVIHEDGSNSIDFRYKSHELHKGKYSLKGLPSMYWEEGEGETLIIRLEDKTTGVEIKLYYGVLYEKDIITRAAEVINSGRKNIILNRALSLCLDFTNDRLDMVHFYGKHAMEREFERTPLHHGRQSIGSVRGTSSHQHNPFVILCKKETTEDYGDCYGISFLYSGSFLAEAEVDQIDQTRFVMGIQPDTFTWKLGEGERLLLPEAALIYSHEGFTGLTHRYHDAIREHVVRGEWKHKKRPVLINNWEATYFDFDGDKLLAIATDAKELGIEMLVLDDGWFGKRDNDLSGLGDWYVNEKKLKGSLKELSQKVHDMGLKFGLWFEPEMVSEDSSLYRAHPDWAIKIPGRNPNRSRSQLVLDFSRDEVYQAVKDMVFQILDEVELEYIKWDMNRSITNLYSAALPAERQGELSHRYVLNLYRFLEELTARYPHILLEGCSGGGGRFDAGMLYYAPQIWCSDDTDAIERLKIQYGTSFGYPIGTVGSHVSASPNHQTGRRTPWETRGTVAMAGSFGYELDLNKLTAEEKELIRGQVKEYNSYYGLIHEGDYYRLTSPYEDTRVTAWQFVSKDKKEGLFCAVATGLQANPSPLTVKLKGLIPEAIYEVEGKEYAGEMLMLGGILLPASSEEYQACRYPIRLKKETLQ
ncbi:alpha-galactosidase [Anaerocolumna xylanovorans]|uniref:Alpha-galactosidase n=1 Tax=Anaerocolumna xylanovorans DSM 12503 TaxID=1121345 RepID=A0A1M7Y8E8_9FIRM|nr:alpha-galactosidase [Anaerocolumna xylanovorans]SHO48914.1 alpha-galactosidase [Anaerocolumna xylanovorans DSM 12503]